MDFNGFVCDGCMKLVDFTKGDEAGTCANCDQFDLGDGCCYCLKCCEKKIWLHCDDCDEYLCHKCHSKSHTCFDCVGVLH